MKIIRLQAENVKRLSAIEIIPSGNAVVIGGRNGAGKSSVLDSIAYALGGKDLVPAEPIRSGETEARIVVELDEFIVTRTFKRDRIDVRDMGVEVHSPGTQKDLREAASMYSATKSNVVVTTREGARFASPQAMLDKLLGKLTFDPLAFAEMDSKTQESTLRNLLGISTIDMDARRAGLFTQRTNLNRQHKSLIERFDHAPFHPNAPNAVTPIGTVTGEIAIAETRQREVEAIRATVEKARGDHAWLEKSETENNTTIAKLEAKIAELESQRVAAIELREKSRLLLAEAAVTLATRTAELEQAQAAVPDLTFIRKKLADLEATNAKVRENDRRKEIGDEAGEVLRQSEQLSEQIMAIDREKAEMLASAKFPVEGLGLREDVGVTFNGVPLEQASSAERLRVSIAIGLALNPSIKVMLVRQASLLDDEAMLSVAAQAAEADAQLWLERVTDRHESVSVMIEDGRVATMSQAS